MYKERQVIVTQTTGDKTASVATLPYHKTASLAIISHYSTVSLATLPTVGHFHV